MVFADHVAITSRVVDEWDAYASGDLATGPRHDDGGNGSDHPEHVVERTRGVDGGDILAGDEGTRMRTGTGEHDRVVAFPHQFGVVPASPEVVADLVVGRERDPLRSRTMPFLFGLIVFDEVDRDLLPVGFVIVGAPEAGAPVVHRVEVPVLQHDVATVADDSAVVRMVVGVEPGPVGRLGGRRQPTGNTTP